MVALVSLLSLVAGSVFPPSLRPAWVAVGDAEVSRSVEVSMAEHHVPTVGLAVIDGGKIASEVAGGASSTWFQAASLSKPLAAVAALILVDRGRLKLDAPIRRIGDWEVPTSIFTESKRPTLRQLLAHTSGMGVPGFAGYLNGPLPSLKEMLEGRPPANSSAMTFVAEPGSVWKYSGGGFLVIQKLIETEARESYATFIAREIFGPAGMKQSGFGSKVVGKGHDALGVEIGYRLYPELAAAGLWTTAEDYAKFLVAIPRLLSKSTVDAMLKPGLNDWGLGVRVNGDWVSHTGRNWGYDAEFRVSRDFSRGVVIMHNSNNDTGFTAELGSAIFSGRNWQGADKFTPRTYHRISAEDQARMAGTYEAAGGTKLDFRAEGIRFYFRLSDGVWRSAVPISRESFQCGMGSLKLSETGLALIVGTRETLFRRRAD